MFDYGDDLVRHLPKGFNKTDFYDFFDIIMKNAWPNLIKDDIKYEEDPQKRTERMLFYTKNKYWEKKWDELGATNKTTHTIVQLIMRKKDLTLVVGDRNVEPAKSIIKSVDAYVGRLK